MKLGAVAAACGSGEPAAPGQAPSLEAGAAPGKAVPTWYRDVEPIVQTACAGCHVANGTGGFLLDRETAVLLAAFLAERVASRIMPPWPPGRGGPAIVDARALDDAAIATITAWAAGGTPLGDERDHVERPARTSRLPARTPDLHLAVPLEGAYRRPDNASVSDEVRCFVLDLPAAAAGGAAIIAAKWQAAHPVGIHLALRRAARCRGRTTSACTRARGRTRRLRVRRRHPGRGRARGRQLWRARRHPVVALGVGRRLRPRAGRRGAGRAQGTCILHVRQRRRRAVVRAHW